MKKLVVILFMVGGLLHAQTSHLHNLYGLTEPTPGLFSVGALNQKVDAPIVIDNTNLNFSLGGPYDFARSSSNVLYVQEDTSFLVLLNNYYLPNTDSAFFGLDGVTTLQLNINAMCFDFNQNDFFYAYDSTSKQLSQLFISGGSALSSPALNINSSFQNSLVYFNQKLFLSGRDTSNELLIRSFDTAFNFLDSTLLSFADVYLFSDAVSGIYGVAVDFQEQNYLISVNSSNLAITVLGQLPSCTNCVNESFLYDRNALVIDAENNQFIAARTEIINGSTSYYLTTFSLQDASIVYDFQTQSRWSNLVYNKPANDLVYPGDANHDKLVNMLDLFPIGIHNLDNTIMRATITTDWIGQVAQNTGDTLANGVDKKHADCNGDGQINVVDIDLAVMTNYNYIHASEKNTSSLCDFPLYISYTNNLKESDSVVVEIGLDMSNNLLQDVYGVAFTIEYDTNFIKPNTLATNGANAWFGTEDGNYIQRFKDNRPLGKMDVGVVGIDKLNRNGGGVLLNSIWSMEDEVIPIAQLYDDMMFRITDVTIIDFDENEIDGCGVDTTIRVYDKMVGIINRNVQTFEISPNPVQNGFIEINHIEHIEQVEVYNIKGALVKTQTNNFDKLAVYELNNGLYFVKVYVEKMVYTAKVVIANKL